MTVILYGRYPARICGEQKVKNKEATMAHKRKECKTKNQKAFFIFASTILVLALLLGCGPSAEELETVDYTPQSVGEWKISTPEKEGLDPELVAELYYNAAELETLYGVLVVKNGHLIAEDYFNEGSVDQKALLQSAAKSITSALVDEETLLNSDFGFLKYPTCQPISDQSHSTVKS